MLSQVQVPTCCPLLSLLVVPTCCPYLLSLLVVPTCCPYLLSLLVLSLLVLSLLVLSLLVVPGSSPSLRVVPTCSGSSPPGSSPYLLLSPSPLSRVEPVPLLQYLRFDPVSSRECEPVCSLRDLNPYPLSVSSNPLSPGIELVPVFSILTRAPLLGDSNPCHL